MLIGKHELVVKRSRFIGLFYKVESEEQAKEIMDNLRLEHKRASHFPYAYIVNNTASKSDDKEPRNTAGTPIYTFLEREGYNSHLIVVIRYYGGRQLGAGPLLRAYAKAAREATF